MPNALALVKKIKTPTELGDLNMQPDTLVCITGHCGSDPTVRQAGSKLVASVNVAVSWGKRPDNVSCWYTIDAWEETGELLAEFSKGDAITITGPRKSREYNDKTYWSLTAWEISRPVYRKQSGAPTPARDAAPRQTQQEVDDDGENIPF